MIDNVFEKNDNLFLCLDFPYFSLSTEFAVVVLSLNKPDLPI